MDVETAIRTTRSIRRFTAEPVAEDDLRVRPDAPVQLLLTGHMDTVFAADHPFQSLKWLEPGVLNGPGTADSGGNGNGVAALFVDSRRQFAGGN